MKTYILNTPILTQYGLWEFEGPLTVEQAQTLVMDGFISAVGHQATAETLTQILGIEIPTHRIEVNLLKGDRALIFRLRQRLPEGKVLNSAELKNTQFELSLLTRIS